MEVTVREWKYNGVGWKDIFNKDKKDEDFSGHLGIS